MNIALNSTGMNENPGVVIRESNLPLVSQNRTTVQQHTLRPPQKLSVGEAFPNSMNSQHRPNQKSASQKKSLVENFYQTAYVANQQANHYPNLSQNTQKFASQLTLNRQNTMNKSSANTAKQMANATMMNFNSAKSFGTDGEQDATLESTKQKYVKPQLKPSTEKDVKDRPKTQEINKASNVVKIKTKRKIIPKEHQ